MRRLYHLPLVVALVVVLVVGCWSRAFAQEHPEPSATATTSASAPAPATASAPATATATASARAPAPSASAVVAGRAAGEIRVHDKPVYVLRASRAGVTAAERARTANAALEALLAQTDDIGEARFEETQGSAVVFVGKTPIVTLGQEDVDAAGEASLVVLAAQVTTRLAQAVSAERKRGAIATTVFSFSLLVFSALLAFLLFNRVSEVATRLRTSVVENPDKVAGIKLGKIDLISAAAARGGLTIALTFGYRLIQIAIGYGWLIFALSLFDATRGYTAKLTGMVWTPLYGLAARVGTALPLIVVAAIAVIALTVLVRFVGLFFDSIARGDTRVAWLPRDLARPTGALARFGIVVVALVLATPLITGEADGVVSRVGLVALVAIALASTPLLASAVVGVLVVFGRRLKKGEIVDMAGRHGRITDITLFDVRLQDDELSEISIPHLLGLVNVTRVHRHAALTTLDVVVDASASQEDVERVLFEAARAMSSRGKVDLLHLDAAGAHWRVTSAAVRHDVSLATKVQRALASIDVGLGSVSERKKEAKRGNET